MNGRWCFSVTTFAEQMEVGDDLVVEKRVHYLVRSLGEGYLPLKFACRYYEMEKHSNEP